MIIEILSCQQKQNGVVVWLQSDWALRTFCYGSLLHHFASRTEDDTTGYIMFQWANDDYSN